MTERDERTLAPSKPAPWNDPKTRAIVFQALAVVVVGYFFYVIFQNTLYNMEKRGISTGFGFLHNQAGFGVLMSLIPYNETDTYGRTFFVGLLNTLLVSGLGIVFATVVGFLVGVARLSSNWLVAKVAMIYIETLRNIPLLLQIFFWYYVVLQALPSARRSMSLGSSLFLNIRGLYLPAPVMHDGAGYIVFAAAIAVIAAVIIAVWANRHQEKTGNRVKVLWLNVSLVVAVPTLVYFIMGRPISLDYPTLQGFNFQGGMRMIPELMALLWALSFYTAAFIAEIVRSGILAVGHGQTEAARSLGLRSGQTLRLIVIPQALRVIVPPLTSQYLNLAKNSSLATAIGYPDLVSVFMGTTLNQTGQAVEIVGMTMAVYLTISLSISGFMNWYNKRVALVER